MGSSWPTCYAALQWPTHFMKSMQWSVHVHFLSLAFIWPSCNFLTPTAPQNIYMAGVAIRGTFATLKILKKNAYILVLNAFYFHKDLHKHTEDLIYCQTCIKKWKFWSTNSCRTRLLIKILTSSKVPNVPFLATSTICYY